MGKLNEWQLKALSDYFNKLSVAWLTGGLITPVLTKPESLIDKLSLPTLGILMASIMLWFSLYVVKEVKI